MCVCVLQTYGTVLAEVGSNAKAVEVFQRAVALAPNEGHEKYMYLSQLLEGPEAIRFSRAGIDILRRSVESVSESEEEARGELKSQLCQAICSLVETMLHSTSNLADFENAAMGITSKEAVSLLKEAEKHHPTSAEPSQVLASLYVELGKADDALQALRKSLSLWRRKENTNANGENQTAHDMDIDDKDEDEEGLPSFEFRFETAKLIMELEEDASEAIEILDDLLAEDDANLDVWFLMTLCHQGMGQLEDALGCLDHLEQALRKFPEDSLEKQNLQTLRADVQRQMKEEEQAEQQQQQQ